MSKIKSGNSRIDNNVGVKLFISFLYILWLLTEPPHVPYEKKNKMKFEKMEMEFDRTALDLSSLFLDLHEEEENASVLW